jgi:hypothetical protein
VCCRRFALAGAATAPGAFFASSVAGVQRLWGSRSSAKRASCSSGSRATTSRRSTSRRAARATTSSPRRSPACSPTTPTAS